MRLDRAKIGYAPYRTDLSAPGDRRRFVRYAASRGLAFELAAPGRQYDLVVLSARADITHWAEVERPTRLVYDLIDSYLDVPPSLENRLRGLAKFVARETSSLALDYRAAIEAMCRRADAVVCSTPEQQERIMPLCPNVHVILDMHPETDVTPKQTYSAARPFRLVWEGLPDNLPALRLIAPAMRAVSARIPLELHVVTDLRWKRVTGRFLTADAVDLVRSIFRPSYIHEWHAGLMPEIVKACDLGVIPLDVTRPLARGKPENKVLLLWRLGLPVLTTSTPAYRRATKEAGLEVCCADPAEWGVALERLVTDDGLRREVGRRGLSYVEAAHSEDATLRRWDMVFESL